MEISLQQTIELLVHEVEANVKRTRVLFSCYHQKSPVNLEKASRPFQAIRLSDETMWLLYEGHGDHRLDPECILVDCAEKLNHLFGTALLVAAKR